MLDFLDPRRGAMASESKSLLNPEIAQDDSYCLILLFPRRCGSAGYVHRQTTQRAARLQAESERCFVTSRREADNSKLLQIRARLGSRESSLDQTDSRA